MAELVGHRDLKLIETGDGGDLVTKGPDLESYFSWENSPYLAMFGGNIEESTDSEDRAQEVQHFDYWANSLFWPDAPEKQFNSRTERALLNTPLNSEGIARIEAAMKEDLSFMETFSTVKVSARIVYVDTVEMNVLVIEPDNLEERRFRYIWNAAKGDLRVAEVNFTSGGTDFDANDFDDNDFL